MEILNQLRTLSETCDDELYRECIESMILKAAEYVEIVTRMETLSMNFPARKGEELRQMVSEADSRRHAVHDALISEVDIVNRICERCGMAPVHTGPARREYADFAFRLVQEIFDNRK